MSKKNKPDNLTLFCAGAVIASFIWAGITAPIFAVMLITGNDLAYIWAWWEWVSLAVMGWFAAALMAFAVADARGDW